MTTTTLGNRQVHSMGYGNSLCVALLVAALGLMGNANLDSSRVDSARDNYSALLQGRIQLGQLSQQELRDILDLHRVLRERDDRSRSQRCVDEEVERLGGSPSELAWRIIDLKCREIGGDLAAPRD